jgi:hypothetical protein
VRDGDQPEARVEHVDSELRYASDCQHEEKVGRAVDRCLPDVPNDAGAFRQVLRVPEQHRCVLVRDVPDAGDSEQGDARDAEKQG